MQTFSFKNIMLYAYSKILRKFTTFSFSGKKFHYFTNSYNNTWINERSIEIPIVLDIIKNFKYKKILELGNVLSHYVTFEHDILDKYEQFPGVINEDVVNFKPKKMYDLIVSVSTLEHVGWDETPKDETKILRAIENLKTMTTKNGIILITIPIGYNPKLDILLKKNILKFDKEFYMKKISSTNNWKEVYREQAIDAKYNYPFSGVNVVVIGFFYADTNPDCQNIP